MGRYVCVFYKTKNKSNVNKKNKQVKIITAIGFGEIISKINNEEGSNLIKSIRDLENAKPNIYNIELANIENKNNFSKIFNDD